MRKKIFATEAVVLNSAYVVKALLVAEQKQALESAERQRRENWVEEHLGSWLHPFRRRHQQERNRS